LTRVFGRVKLKIEETNIWQRKRKSVVVIENREELEKKRESEKIRKSLPDF